MKLANNSGAAISLYRPAGEAGSLTVEPGQSCEIPGELVTEAPEGYELPNDALLVRLPDGELRTFATSMWSAEQKETEHPTVAATVVDAPITNQEPNPTAETGSTAVQFAPTSAVTPKDEV